MSFISRLLSMYILINFCHNALCIDSNVEIYIDSLEDQREDNDDYNQDDQKELFDQDYYSDVAGTRRKEDDESADDVQEDDEGVEFIQEDYDGLDDGQEYYEGVDNIQVDYEGVDDIQEDDEGVDDIQEDDEGVEFIQEDYEGLDGSQKDYEGVEFIQEDYEGVDDIKEDDEGVDDIQEDDEGVEFIQEDYDGLDDSQEYYEGVDDIQVDYEGVDDIPKLMTLKNKKAKDNKDPTKQIVILDTMDTRNYRAELEAGNRADLMGTNPHYYQPNAYPDFSRRFMPQYLYTEVVKKNRDRAEKNKLTPQLAPPELVLQVAKESAIHEAKHKTQKDELIRKDILRTGNYWNSVWKDVDPQALRSNKQINLESVRAEIPPGKLYNLILKLKTVSPILYIINEKKSSN